MTIFRYDSVKGSPIFPVIAGVAGWALSSCGSVPQHRYPDTAIGKIFQLGNTSQINTQLVGHLSTLGGQLTSELALSGFVGPREHDGCMIWSFREPEEPGDRDGILGMAKYNLFVSVTKCGTKLNVKSGYTGL